MFSTTKELEQAVLEVATETIPNSGMLSESILKSAVETILSQKFQLESPNKREYLQIVQIIKDQAAWVPVTIHFQISEEGILDYVRIHAPRFVVESTI